MNISNVVSQTVDVRDKEKETRESHFLFNSATVDYFEYMFASEFVLAEPLPQTILPCRILADAVAKSRYGGDKSIYDKNRRATIYDGPGSIDLSAHTPLALDHRLMMGAWSMNISRRFTFDSCVYGHAIIMLTRLLKIIRIDLGQKDGMLNIRSILLACLIISNKQLCDNDTDISAVVKFAKKRLGFSGVSLARVLDLEGVVLKTLRWKLPQDELPHTYVETLVGFLLIGEDEAKSTVTTNHTNKYDYVELIRVFRCKINLAVTYFMTASPRTAEFCCLRIAMLCAAKVSEDSEFLSIVPSARRHMLIEDLRPITTAEIDCLDLVRYARNDQVGEKVVEAPATVKISRKGSDPAAGSKAKRSRSRKDRRY